MMRVSDAPYARAASMYMDSRTWTKMERYDLIAPVNMLSRTTAPSMTQMLRLKKVPIMIMIGRKGRIMLTSVMRWINSSTHFPYQAPMAAMIMVMTEVPKDATSPNMSAMGAPHNKGTIRSRRAMSVPASP